MGAGEEGMFVADGVGFGDGFGWCLVGGGIPCERRFAGSRPLTLREGDGVRSYLVPTPRAVSIRREM